MNLEEITKVLEEAKNNKTPSNRRRGRPSKKVVETEETLRVPQVEELKDNTQDKTDRILDNDSDDIKEELLDTWKPYQLEDYVLPEFKIPVRNSNNYEASKKEMLSKILTFVDNTQRKRFKNGCTVIPIPTTSKQNLMIWGYPMAIDRAIKYMKEMGLITVHDDTYRFGAPFEGGNYGKLYAYYVDNERKFVQYCKENGIHKYVVKNVQEITSEEDIAKIKLIDELITFDIRDVRFGTSLSLKKPEGISKNDFKMFLTECLYSNYPEFKFHQLSFDEI